MDSGGIATGRARPYTWVFKVGRTPAWHPNRSFIVEAKRGANTGVAPLVQEVQPLRRGAQHMRPNHVQATIFLLSCLIRVTLGGEGGGLGTVM